jgi:hypothetical protein
VHSLSEANRRYLLILHTLKIGIPQAQAYPSPEGLLMKNHRTHELESWHQTESQLAIEIASSIVDEEAREFLLRPTFDRLELVKSVILRNAASASSPADANRWFDAAELELGTARKQLLRAQELVAKYGTSIQLIGE